MRMARVDMAAVKRLAQAPDPAGLAELLGALPPADAARALAQVWGEAIVDVFRRLPTDLATEVLAEMPEDVREDMLQRLEPQEIAEVVEQMPSDEATDVLQDMEPNDAEQVLAQLEPDTRADLTELAEYDEDSAGGIMAKEFAAVRASATAAEALGVLRRQFPEVEDLNIVFATSGEGRLLGSCSLRDLVFARPTTEVSDLVERHAYWVQKHQDQEAVAHYMRLHGLEAVPVVDEHHRVIGQITLEDAAEVMDEEAAEDMRGVAGLMGNEPVFGPLAASIGRRLPWLLINAPLAVAGASIIGFFTHVIAAAAILVVFLPVVGGMAGNAAGQTLAVFIRGLALGEVRVSDVWRSLWRQSLIGLTVGLILAAVLAVVAMVWRHSAGLCVVVGLALLLNCLTGVLLGTLLPLALRRLGLDPAMGSNIVATSLTDATGYAYLLGLGSLGLHHGWLSM